MAMEPAPSLDKENKDPGHCDLWGHILGKNKKHPQDLLPKCQRNNTKDKWQPKTDSPETLHTATQHQHIQLCQMQHMLGPHFKTKPVSRTHKRVVGKFTMVN